MRNRCLLIGDRRFIKGTGTEWYTEGPKGAETGERYMRWFSDLTVVGRAGDVNGVDTGRLNILDSEVIKIVTVPNLSGIRLYLKNLSHTRKKLLALIQQHDAVIARMPTQLGLEAISLALRVNKPIAVDLGGCVLDGLRAYGTLKAWMVAPIVFRRVRSAISQVHWVSYVTQEYLQKRYPPAPNAHAVSCSNVDLPAADETLLQQRLRRVAESKHPLVFGSIASLHGKFKGIQHALQALSQAKSVLPPFEYRVLGGGNSTYWRRLVDQHGLSKQVVFEGTLPAGAPVLQWLDQVDIYLQPSLREGVPRALIEAMSRGCPAIASDIAGIPELLPPEVLHGAGDVKRLAELMMVAVGPDFISSQASRNWEKAKDFTGERLGAIRNEFWGAFAMEACSRKANLAGRDI